MGEQYVTDDIRFALRKLYKYIDTQVAGLGGGISGSGDLVSAPFTLTMDGVTFQLEQDANDLQNFIVTGSTTAASDVVLGHQDLGTNVQGEIGYQTVSKDNGLTFSQPAYWEDNGISWYASVTANNYFIVRMSDNALFKIAVTAYAKWHDLPESTYVEYSAINITGTISRVM